MQLLLYDIYGQFLNQTYANNAGSVNFYVASNGTMGGSFLQVIKFAMDRIIRIQSSMFDQINVITKQGAPLNKFNKSTTLPFCIHLSSICAGLLLHRQWGPSRLGIRSILLWSQAGANTGHIWIIWATVAACLQWRCVRVCVYYIQSLEIGVQPLGRMVYEVCWLVNSFVNPR
jgi:hypothetical protein